MLHAPAVTVVRRKVQSKAPGDVAAKRMAVLPSGHEPRGPEKIYYKIGEAAALCDLPAYVLRYWETEFPELRPRKTGSGRRIYSRADLELLRRLKKLLHEERYTIQGARQILAGAAVASELPAAGAEVPRILEGLARLRRDLRELGELVSRPRPRKG